MDRWRVMFVGGPRAVERGEVQGFDARRSLLDDAHAVLAIHVAGPDGICLGCAEGWSRRVPAPCSAVRLWLSIVETHGVSAWDLGARNAGEVVCDTCVGRGWKFVSSRANGLWSESLDGLIRRSCVDCGGEGVLRHG
jgi:hypothetical protein